jgi:hypothetical protein
MFITRVRRMKTFQRSIGIVVLFVVTALAQSYESGSVVKWETKAFAMTAVHPAGNRVVYSIKVGEVTYQVARRSAKVEMTMGEKIQCRIEKDKFVVRDDKGKETKYDIVGTEANTETSPK